MLLWLPLQLACRCCCWCSIGLWNELGTKHTGCLVNRASSCTEHSICCAAGTTLLLLFQGVPMGDVMRVLQKRFGTIGIMRTLHSVLYTEYCIYHAVAAAAAAAAILMLLLLLLQGVPMEDVMRVLRKRFGTSGIAEKAARPPKQ